MGGNSSPSVSLWTFRNLFISLVVFQVLRMMTMDKTGPSPSGSEVADNGKPSGPKGREEHLNSFKVQGNKQGQVVDNDDAAKGQETDASDGKDDDGKAQNDDGKDGDDEVQKTDAPDGKGDAEQPDKEVGQQESDSLAGLNRIVIDKKGTGPTSVGYVKDFIHERDNPAYRNLETPFMDHSPTIAKLINEKSVIPCHDETDGSTNPRCLDNDTPLIAYNSESFQRTWCGQEIKAKSAVLITEHCMDPVAHLFPAEVPPITGDHMPPIIIKTSANKEVQEGDLEKVECNIPCQQEKGLKFDGDCFIDGEPWKITRTMNYAKSMSMDRTDFMKDHYFSSQFLHSSVPLSTFDYKIHSLRNRPMVDFETAEEKAIYMADDKCTVMKRNRWFDGVRKKVTVDSYGNCGHNVEVPQGMTISTPEGRIDLSKRYRIVLAYDETATKDHISDVVWEAFVSGAVPVVLGADNLRDRFPPNSFINVHDFNKYDELGDHIKKVLSDKELWLSYHKWRDDETAIAAFESQYEFARTDPTCRLCRWAYAKKYGLGWDHKKQEVRSVSKVSNDEFCTTADHGLVSKPFSEQWVTKGSGEDNEKILEEDSEGQSCSSLGIDGDITVGSFKVHRKVFHHDGVTDFIITESIDESADAETTLRLKFPGVRNPDGACFYNTHTLVSTAKGSKVSSASIQDDLVKVTILANWDTTVKSSGEGIMEVAIKNDSVSKTDKGESAPRRVRVIIEETNIHDKMTEFFPSSYGKLTTKDFIDPVGVFFVDS
jgi:hypothetical protein